MIKPNIGIINSMIRITCGFTFLTYSTVRMIRQPDRNGSFLLTAMAAMKVAEGVVRYCPVTDLATKAIDNNTPDGETNPSKEMEEAINPS